MHEAAVAEAADGGHVEGFVGADAVGFWAGGAGVALGGEVAHGLADGAAGLWYVRVEEGGRGCGRGESQDGERSEVHAGLML